LRIGVVNNLRAGRNAKGVARLLGFLRSHPEILHVETESAEVMPEALAELARQEVDLLAVNGGDGTLQYILTEILSHRIFGDTIPMIAPLRGGRTNMSALDLGARRDPIRGLTEILDAVRDGRLAERVDPRNVLRVEYGIRREVTYGMFFGVGTIHRAIELNHRLFDGERTRKIEGVPGATLVTAGLLGRMLTGDTSGILAPDKLQILLDGEMVPQGEFYLAIATSLTRLFARMRPFWGHGPGGVRFTTMASGAERVGRAVPGILRGKPQAFVTPENGYTSRNVDLAELRLNCGFTVDGELWDPEPGRTVSVTADSVIPFVRA